MPMMNLLPQDFVQVDASGTEIRRIQTSGTVARAIPGEAVPVEDLSGVPSVRYAPPVRVDGLPGGGGGAIIVTAHVADAMRSLGLRHDGGVYTPQPLVFVKGKPAGAPGLIRHDDLDGF